MKKIGDNEFKEYDISVATETKAMAEQDIIKALKMEVSTLGRKLETIDLVVGRLVENYQERFGIK